MLIYSLIQGKDSSTYLADLHSLHCFTEYFHTTVHHIDLRKQLTLSADGLYRCPILRLPVMRQNEVL